MTDKNRLSVDPAKTDRSQEPVLEVGLIELGRVLVRRAKVIGTVALVATVITAVVMLLTPNKYTSHASVLPSGQTPALNGLMGLAGSFGGAAAVADNNSSALFPSILRSDVVRDEVIDREYHLATDDSDTLITLSVYFDRSDQSELRNALGEVTGVRVDKKLGVISLGVTTTIPGLSQQVLRQYLVSLEDYLVNKRRSQALQSADYLERQQSRCRQTLSAVEDSLETFMAANRNWARNDDPYLQTELARLRREVELSSQTYLLLNQQLEVARLDAQKDIPIVRILDQPSLPTRKSGPHRTMTTLFVLLASITLSGSYHILVYVIRKGLSPQDLASVRRARDEMAHYLQTPKRVLRLSRSAPVRDPEEVF